MLVAGVVSDRWFKLDDEAFLDEIDSWALLAITVGAAVPAVLVLARRRERTFPAVERRRRWMNSWADPRRQPPRLSTALTRALGGREAADRLFDELESTLGIEKALIAIVDDEADGRRLCGPRRRGGVVAKRPLDTEQGSGAIVTVAREANPYAVYDVATAPNINRALAERVGAKSAAFVPGLRRAHHRVLVAATGDAATALLDRRPRGQR